MATVEARGLTSVLGPDRVNTNSHPTTRSFESNNEIVTEHHIKDLRCKIVESVIIHDCFDTLTIYVTPTSPIRHARVLPNYALS
jgi:hypothetical protein